jgi:N-acetylmuramoyl-L-alanine amidase
MTDSPAIICIDPGHPSEAAAGAVANGVSETHINWVVARRTAQKLHESGIAFVLTKSSEHQFVSNRSRAEIANRAHAALFVRLHCDTGSGSGYTWYYPDRSARHGNVTGPSREVQRASREAAAILNSAMQPVLKDILPFHPVKTDAATHVGGRQGGVLTGSIFSHVPTALIEMCNLNRKSDALFIASTIGQEKMAEALVVAIQTYLKQRQS